MIRNLKLSVLDQSPVRKGGTAQQALKETLSLAKAADELGYTRYWLSEHHNTGSLAGSAPEVLIPYLASQTTTIRLGSGGIMLPNHSALKVAENFKTLETLFPGRIDLGIGRAPGGDRITASLLNPSNNFNEKDFIQQLIDLQHYLDLPTRYDNYNERVRAIPEAETAPDLWLLSSSGQSGLFAAHFGMAFSFAHFISPAGGPEAMQLYKDRFEPSASLTEPLANVGLFVMCAETEERAQELQKVMDVQFLRIEQAISQGIPSYQEIKNLRFTAAEEERILFNRQRMVCGTPEKVKENLLAIADDYDVDELVVVTITHDFSDRIRSYQLLAEAFGLKRRN